MINFNVPLLKQGGIKRLVNPNHDLVDEHDPLDRAKYRTWIEEQKNKR